MKWHITKRFYRENLAKPLYRPHSPSSCSTTSKLPSWYNTTKPEHRRNESRVVDIIVHRCVIIHIVIIQVIHQFFLTWYAVDIDMNRISILFNILKMIKLKNMSPWWRNIQICIYVKFWSYFFNFSAFLKKIDITFKVSNSSMFCIKKFLRSISLKSFGNILEKYIVRLIYFDLF